MDLQNMCRVCPEKSNLINLFSFSSISILTYLKTVIIMEDENITQLPRHICQACHKSIENIIDFNTKCIQRDSELREMLRLTKTPVDINIKNEEEYDLSVKAIKFEEILVEPKLEEMVEDIEIPPDDQESVDNLNEEKTHICTICNEMFPKVTKLQQHRNQSHKSCPDCSKTFASYILMNSHRKRSHLNEKCPDCELVFDTQSLLTNHQILVHQLDASSVKKSCPICGKLFLRNSHVRKHIRSIHENIKCKQSNEACPICGKEFKFRSNIARHIESVHNKVRNYPCTLCDKSYFEKTHLANHMALHLDDRPFLCDHPNCGKSFKILPHLTIHQKIHLVGEERAKLKQNTSFICSYCGKSLSSKISFEGHVRSHTNEKPFNCKICSKAFNRQLTLNVHMRVHTNEKPYNCKICNQRFKQNSHLRAHHLTHETEKKFICSVCDFATKHKYNLDIHMRNVHINERKHQCEQCSEVFFNGKLLRKHVESKHK